MPAPVVWDRFTFEEAALVRGAGALGGVVLTGVGLVAGAGTTSSVFAGPKVIVVRSPPAAGPFGYSTAP